MRKLLPASVSRWDTAALAGGVIGAGLWFVWSVLGMFADYNLDQFRGWAGLKTGWAVLKRAPDWATSFYILLIPLVIVRFRGQIDRLLLPLQKLKQFVPRLVLIGVGLAIPYLMAYYFYGEGPQGTQFPFARKTIIWGTILSYVIMRVPDQARSSGSVNSLRRRLVLVSWIWLALGVQWLAAGMVFGDDFTRDFRRLEDGLRTPGWAQTIAGTAGTLISGVINLGLVFQRYIPPPPGSAGAQAGGGEPGKEGKKEEPVRYTMDIKTEEQRMSLVADDKDRLGIYAQLSCSKRGVRPETLTQPISFSIDGNYANWLSIKTTKFQGGYKAALLAARPPAQDAKLEEGAKVTVRVSGATLEGEPIDVPVSIELEDELKMEVKILA